MMRRLTVVALSEKLKAREKAKETEKEMLLLARVRCADLIKRLGDIAVDLDTRDTETLLCAANTMLQLFDAIEHSMKHGVFFPEKKRDGLYTNFKKTSYYFDQLARDALREYEGGHD